MVRVSWSHSLCDIKLMYETVSHGLMVMWSLCLIVFVPQSLRYSVSCSVIFWSQCFAITVSHGLIISVSRGLMVIWSLCLIVMVSHDLIVSWHHGCGSMPLCLYASMSRSLVVSRSHCLCVYVYYGLLISQSHSHCIITRVSQFHGLMVCVSVCLCVCVSVCLIISWFVCHIAAVSHSLMVSVS